MSENSFGGGIFYNYDWDDAVDDGCVYPPGDCDSCPLRNVCKTRKMVMRDDALL